MLNSKIIKRYQKKTVTQLKKIATTHFNKYIRLRDKENTCISCNKGIDHAGHFYSSGHYSGLKFNEDNVHGQCLQCNYFKHGNLIEYRKNLILKIGLERVEKLDALAKIYKRTSFKWNKITLINIIETYKNIKT